MAAVVRCARCHGTFDGEHFVDHITDGTCRPSRLSPIGLALAVVGALALAAGLLELADAAAANPGGFASWTRVVVGAVIAAAGTRYVWRVLR